MGIGEGGFHLSLRSRAIPHLSCGGLSFPHQLYALVIST